MFAHLAQLKKRYSWIWSSGWPFVVASDATPLERLRVYGLQVELAGRRAITRLIGWPLMLVCWPITSLFGAIKAARKDRSDGGTSAWEGFRKYYSAAILHNARPGDLQSLQVSSGIGAEMAPHLMYNRDSRIWQALNRVSGANGEDVQDKARFYLLARQAGLPVVPVYAAFSGGESLLPIDRAAATGSSLFVKSLRGQQGQGAAIWRWGEHDGVAGYGDGTGVYPTLDALLAALSHEDCVVQPLLVDHAALRAAGSEGLSSLRIVTVRTPEGQVQAACSLLLMAKGMLSQYGHSYAVDIHNGRLTTWLDTSEGFKRSPVAEDFALPAIPEWAALVEMVCQAHRTGFAAFSSLGWDVVLTDDGPLLLEANQGWGIMLHQVLGEPLGHTAIGTAAAAWLDHLAKR
ncbi:MAG: sugar-transfer associated ATP-grasp domain-containing protein [Novosphingobium sp.]